MRDLYPVPDYDRTFITPWHVLLNTKPPTFTVQQIIPKGQVVWLYGATGIGKSLIASSIATDVCQGNTVFGQYASEQANVLWLDYENGPEEHMHRLRSAGIDLMGLAATQAFHIGTFPETITGENAEHLLQDVDDRDIGLLVIDSSGVGIAGDSNSADTYATFAQHLLNPLKQRGVTVLILDNVGKDASKGAIGSSRKGHEAGAVWKLTKTALHTHLLTAMKKRTLGLADRIEIKQHTQPLRWEAINSATAPEVLTGEQQVIVTYLDTLDGAKMFPDETLYQKCKDAGVSVRKTATLAAIRWWNRGDHVALD